VYKFEYKIGDFNCQPVFENWTYSTDDAGGVEKDIANSFYQWAKLKPRTGGRTFIAGDITENNQTTWIYDMEVVIRYNSLIQSDTTMVWEGKRYAITYFTIQDEGKKRFIRMFVTMTDDQSVTPSIVNPMEMSYYFNYTAIGDNTQTITETSLINKTVFGVFKDGVAKTIIVVGSPDSNEVLYEPSSGEFTFGMPLYDGERVIIQYL
jgi:SPP1 family predicted phage head-tail adaptor